MNGLNRYNEEIIQGEKQDPGSALFNARAIRYNANAATTSVAVKSRLTANSLGDIRSLSVEKRARNSGDFHVRSEPIILLVEDSPGGRPLHRKEKLRASTETSLQELMNVSERYRCAPCVTDVACKKRLES